MRKVKGTKMTTVTEAMMTEEAIKEKITLFSQNSSFEDLIYMSDKYKVNALMLYVKLRAVELEKANPKEGKEVFYVSMEALPGRTFGNTVMNLPEREVLYRIMKELGITVDMVECMERDPSIGNGGLGRLGPCMMESSASQNYNFTLVVPCYKTGLFRQELKDGRQVEEPDWWMDENGEYFYAVTRKEDEQKVYFKDVCLIVTPSDILQVGRRGTVNALRMLMVTNIEAAAVINTEIYEQINDKLYPEDSAYEGKMLRMVQEYTLSAATVGMAVSKCRKQEKSLEVLEKECFLHINDTHSSWMVPELMRILLDEEHWSWEKAWAKVNVVFGYTNHTILAEALEKWPLSMVRSILPRIAEIMEEISRRFNEEVASCGMFGKEEAENMQIIRDGMVNMAYMDIYAAYRVNGVAALHTKILCERELSLFYRMYPEKFCNITNGVTQRLFLEMANPKLAGLITRCLRSEEWTEDMTKLEEFSKFTDDPKVQEEFQRIKFEKKAELSGLIEEQTGEKLPVHFIYVIQSKRMHEYKRQQMSCAHILSLYFRLKANPKMEMQPTAFIFSGKAASGYRQAKLVIELIHALADLVNHDPEVNQKLRVYFIKDYNVSKAKIMFAAADVSSQISTASKEASGTGNMKFMMNGALTLGTLDGANVEICQEVGEKNMFLFGLTSGQVMKYESEPGSYHPFELYQKNEQLYNVVNALKDGFLRRKNVPWGESERFSEIADEWLYGKDGNAPDRFFVLEDFFSYDQAFWRMNFAYQDKAAWTKAALYNIARSGVFSSDRMVKEYNEKIWHLE